jgi:hypothetical protein
MEISPASITQLRQARNGRWTTISPEEGGVAGELRDIDSSLRLRKSEENGIYVVYQVDEAGDESLVTTADRWSWPQLPDRVRRIRHSSYDFVKELDRLDAEADRERDRSRREHVGDVGERLLHSLQKDLGVQNTVFLGDEVGSRRRRKGLK